MDKQKIHDKCNSYKLMCEIFRYTVLFVALFFIVRITIYYVQVLDLFKSTEYAIISSSGVTELYISLLIFIIFVTTLIMFLISLIKGNTVSIQIINDNCNEEIQFQKNEKISTNKQENNPGTQQKR